MKLLLRFRGFRCKKDSGSGCRRRLELVRSCDASAKAGALPFLAMPLDLPPELLHALEDHQALLAAVDAANGRHPVDEAREAVRRILVPAEATETVAEHVSQAAMRRFVGEPVTGPVIEAPIPLQEHLEDAVGLAWVAWARNDGQEARKLLARIEPLIEARRHGSGMTLLGLLLWGRALVALLDGDHGEARTLWGRALEVGTTFGLDATTMLRWTYAATFAA